MMAVWVEEAEDSLRGTVFQKHTVSMSSSKDAKQKYSLPQLRATAHRPKITQGFSRLCQGDVDVLCVGKIAYVIKKHS